MMREENHVFQGMRRGNHPIKLDAKFLWDAHNIRITNREDNTLLSITNEKGTSDSLVEFQGYYVGHCVLGKYLVVFTANDDGSDNYIYRVEKTESGYKLIVLFHLGEVWDHSWFPSFPIETLGVYETEFVLKVYWVDGKNQPRLINIAKPELEIPEEYLSKITSFSGPNYSEDPEVALYMFFKYKEGVYKKESFDFVRDLALQEQVEIIKIYGLGLFSPGTILYAFSYYDKYGLESNIWYTTPIYYISPEDRGGSPEDKVSNSFNIKILYPDTNFDYIRVYSIHRSSIDAIPTVRVAGDITVKVDDIREKDKVFLFTDTGTIGYTITPTQLLYIGGTSIIANCIALKDGTLFLGGITLLDGTRLKEVKEIIEGRFEVDDWEPLSSGDSPSMSSVYYSYKPSLSEYSAGFTSGEKYRCGILVQYSNGKWSEPIFLGDYELCNRNAWEALPLKESKSIRFLGGTGVLNSLKEKGVRRIRTCVVFPKAFEREVICLGVLCPTVFGVLGRKNDSPYAISSWFFRPATDIASLDNSLNVYHGASILFLHNKSLFSADDRGAEILNMLPGAESLSDVNTKEKAEEFSSHFFVDENIVTFHSPDLEFDTALSNYSWEGVSLRIVGMAKLGAIAGDIDILTSTPPVSSVSPGFVHTTIGYLTKNDYRINGGLVMAPFYRDYSLKTDYNTSTDCFWPVYPWNKTGSLNNDNRRPDNKGTQSAVLHKKKLSNLKFFDKNVPLGVSPLIYRISTPLLFSSNELSMVKITPSYLKKEVPYLGNVDTLITSSKAYNIYSASSFAGKFSTLVDTLINTTNDPVRIKYKSTPHLVFSLGLSTSEIPLLPRHAAIGNTLNSEFQFPIWQQSGSSDGSNDDKLMYNYLMWMYSNKGVKPLTMLIPPENRVGTCSIYNFDGLRYVARVDKASIGTKWTTLSPNKTDGIILKVTAGVTTIDPSGNYIPGTTKDDYSSGNVYLGKDRYYKVHVPYGELKNFLLEDITNLYSTSTGESNITAPLYRLSQASFGDLNDVSGTLPYLLIGELIRDNVVNKFGGNSEEAISLNLWFPAGKPVSIGDESEDLVVPFEYGDTWYSRYDCLKTYPFTLEDENSVIEIGSFMCETRINIDGRYDKNRGLLSNITMSPLNFNLFNEVYSQKDNFFNYRILDEDFNKLSIFANQITWSREKHAGEDVDPWTNITLANTLDLDGERGSVTSIKPWNEYLLCFLDKAINQILFNSRALIPVSDGVPIEISNGYKVDGSRAINNNIGCSNKWSIVPTTNGVYFLDTNTDSIYLFNGLLSNLSEATGMDWWCRDNHTTKIWNPVDYATDINGIRTFYDNKYGDVYFTPGPKLGELNDALCYSEQLQQFTSLMSYGGVNAMFNFADGFYSLRDTDGNVKLYQNNVGDYNNFYGSVKGWDFSFISNENPTITKIFDTIETRADSFDGSTVIGDEYSTKKQSGQPFNFIRVSNEYQDTRWYDEEGKPKDIVFNSSNLRKKFRVWRAILPRNYGTRQRIRNPWSMITLGWNPLNTTQPGDNTKKAVVHDVSVHYTV